MPITWGVIPSVEGITSTGFTPVASTGRPFPVPFEGAKQAIPTRTHPRLLAIAALFDEANAGTPNISYAVAGDSTRNNSYNDMVGYYYPHQLNKVNVATIDNARSGQSAQNWSTDSFTPHAGDLISSIPSSGSDTIVEYSLGINDYKNGATEAQVKGWIKDGLNRLLVAKPDVLLFLVTPTPTANTERNAVLLRIYEELAEEYDVPLVDVFTGMNAIYDGLGAQEYYNDSTHPNRYGSMRCVNIIMDAILPASLYSTMTLDTDYQLQTPPSEDNLAEPVESGFWSSSTGGPSSNSGWRRMQAVAVEPNFTLQFYHGGNRADAKFMDDQGTFLEGLSGTAVSGEEYREITVPDGAYNMRLNVSSDAATWDAGGFSPYVYYKVPDDAALSIAQINTGLSIGLTVE